MPALAVMRMSGFLRFMRSAITIRVPASAAITSSSGVDKGRIRRVGFGGDLRARMLCDGGAGEGTRCHDVPAAASSASRAVRRPDGLRCRSHIAEVRLRYRRRHRGTASPTRPVIHHSHFHAEGGRACRAPPPESSLSGPGAHTSIATSARITHFRVLTFDVTTPNTLPSRARSADSTDTLVALVEFFGALALVAGLLTRLAGLALAVTMLGALFMLHLAAASFTPKGIEVVLTLTAVAATLAVTGGGRIAVDALVVRRTARRSEEVRPLRSAA